MRLRELVFETAAEIGIGDLVETLKWNQPAYLTGEPRTGSTIRIDALKNRPGACAMFFHCQTTLVSTFRDMYRDTFAFEGNRAIIFAAEDEISEEALKHCISLALTYHAKPARSTGRDILSDRPARARKQGAR
jgi:hypothetical protein